MSQSNGEKTEKPTDKRVRDARRKGQVAKSQDLSAAILLIAAVTTLWLGSNLMLDGLSAAMRDGIQQAASFEGELDRATANCRFLERRIIIWLPYSGRTRRIGGGGAMFKGRRTGAAASAFVTSTAM